MEICASAWSRAEVRCQTLLVDRKVKARRVVNILKIAMEIMASARLKARRLRLSNKSGHLDNLSAHAASAGLSPLPGDAYRDLA